MENKKTVILCVIFLAIGLLVGFFGGNALGNQNGQATAEKKYSPLVDLAFPKPADDIRSLTGTVMSISGATINLKADDPADYLPHPDGSPRATKTVSANVTPDTKYVFVVNGKTKTTPSSISDIKNGDVITVRANTNIKDTVRFDAAEIDVVK